MKTKRFGILAIALLIVAMVAMVPSASATYISLENAVVGQNYYFLKSAEGEIIYADFHPSGWAVNRIAKINHRSLDYFWNSAALDVYSSTDGRNWKWKQHGAISYPVTTIIKMEAGVHYRFVMQGYTAPYFNVNMNIVQDLPWNY
ncbi:hypothetical protein KJ854_04700 [Patescibacteria group bacterium]|nr:hypothetical protein [Patescibacteria group bacterium]